MNSRSRVASLLALPMLLLSVTTGFTQNEDTATADNASEGAASGALAPGSTITSRETIAVVGDTLASIARRELGSGGLTWSLAEFNDLDAATVLEAGQIVLVPLYTPAASEVARAIFVKGTVELEGTALERNSLVSVGDVITTGPDGFASLEFWSGTLVNLQPDTVARITRLSCLESAETCIVEVESNGGELKGDVNARDGQPLEFRLTTPFAAAAVRGTTFSIIADPRVLRTAVTEGVVAVQAMNAETSLEPGFGSVTNEGEPPGEPIALLRPPVFRSLPVRATAGDMLGWFELLDAREYNAVFAADRAGREAVAKLENDDVRLTVPPELDSGDYFLAVNGVDENGLSGYSTTVRVAVADLAPDIAPLEASISREASEFIVEVVDPPESAPGFEIQVSITPEFDDPLSIDVSNAGRAILSLDADTLYARVRTLLDPFTVSAFGPVASGG